MMKKLTLILSIIFISSSCHNTEPEEYIPMDGSQDRIFSFAIFNNYLYTSSITKLTIYGISDPSNPVKIKELENFTTRNLTVFGNDLYFPQYATRIYSLNATPENPAYKSNINAGECDLITANDTYAFTVIKENSICRPTLKGDHVAIYDVANTNTGVPIQNGTLGKINAIVLYGNYLIAGGEQDITVYDATNPVTIHSVKTIPNVVASDLLIQGDRLFAFSNSTVKQFSIDPANIQNISLISSYPL